MFYFFYNIVPQWMQLSFCHQSTENNQNGVAFWLSYCINTLKKSPLLMKPGGGSSIMPRGGVSAEAPGFL